MARDPTRFSRVSIGWVDSEQTIQDVDGSDTDAILSIGQSNVDILDVSTSTHATALGAIAAQDASVTTLGISGATRGDTYIVNLDSEFSGQVNDYQLVWNVHSGDTTGEANLVVSNVSSGSVNPTDGVIRVTRINFASYL